MCFGIRAKGLGLWGLEPACDQLRVITDAGVRSEHNNALFNTKLDQALCLPCPWKTKKEGGDEETSHRNGLM